MINKLKLNPNNPRKITKPKFKQLKKNIEKFPKGLELRQIIYDENLIVVGGNQRLKALRELVEESKLKSKPEYFKAASDLTKKERRMFIIIDNVESGTFDDDEIVENWDKQELEEWGLEVKEWDDVGGNEEVDTEKLMDEDKKITCPKCQFEFEE